MSYISAWRKGNDVFVWERTEDGRKTKVYPGIFEFYSKDERGKYVSIYGERLVKHEFRNWWEFNEGRKPFVERAELLYESDIGPELKILSQHYYQVDAPNLNLTLWDIEVDYDPLKSFADTRIETPDAPINAVALYHHWKDESIVIAVPPKSWDKSNKLQKLAKETNTDIRLVENERELLLMFIDEIQDSDVISGWNSDWFDTPFMAKRIQRVLGDSEIRHLSFPDANPPSYRTVEVFGQERTTIDLGGRISWDYLELFKKFEMAERPSYTLEAISNELLPDLPKLEYEGTLHELYNNDFEHFVRYNIRDTEVLAGFERKLGYISLANVLYHSSCGQPNQIFGTIRLADLAITNHCHYNLNRRVPDWDQYKEDGRITGAMVLTPKVGLHDYIGSIDITSLYPSAIRCVNISPETLVGQTIGYLDNDDRAKHSAWDAIYRGDPDELVTVVYDKHMDGYDGEETHSGAEWRTILEERKWAVSGYGTFFRQDEQGIIPAVLTDWFAQRKAYKKKMGQAKDQAEKTTDPIEKRKLLEQADYFDRLQYVYKIKLNSLYGALTNYHFRLFDLRLGQSTTGTGRAILDHMCSQTALILDGKYDMFSESIAYGDSVAGDSILHTSNGDNVRIEDLFHTIDNTIGTKQYHHPSNLKVLTYDETTNKSCYKSVKYVMRHKADKQMYRVWTTNDTYIDVTEDHSLIGYVNTRLRKKGESRLREIKPQEFGTDINRLIQLKSRPRERIESKSFSKEFYELLGLIIGDGGANHRQSGIELSLGVNDKDEIIEKTLNPLIDQGWITSITHMKNGHDLRLCGTKLWDTVRELLYVNSIKQIPKWIDLETEDNICSILRGYFTADGGVTGNAIRLTSVHKPNIVRVRELLTYCGIASNYFTETTKNSFKGKFSNTYSSNLIVKSKSAFIRKVGFILDRKTEAIPKPGKKDSYFDNIDFDITGVVKIEKIDFDGYVYDIEVEDTHTFFANNILVHNTDSVYFRTNAEVGAEGLSKEQIYDRAIKIADRIGELADASFDEFCKKAFCIQPEFENIIKCDREVVAKRGIFVSKKRYVLKLIDLDGYRVNKLKAMGLEMKKTTTPKMIQKFLEDVVNMILDGDDSWDDIDDYIIKYRLQVREELPVLMIGLPKGVKKVEHYTRIHKAGVDDNGEKPRLPGHVAAAIHYNECLERYQDHDNAPIVTGSKIKVFYLSQKHGKFKSIAFPTELEKAPQWFEDNYQVDRVLHEEKLIDSNLEKIFIAIGREVPTAQSKFNNSLMEW